MQKKTPFPPGLAARRAVLTLLRQVTAERVLLDQAQMPEGLEPSEQARALRLVRLILRNRARLDAVVDHYAQKSPPPAARDALRLCAAEALLDNVPAHAAVNGAVDVVRMRSKTKGLVGFVNAVGRKIVTEGAEVIDSKHTQRLPKTLRKRLVGQYNVDTVRAFEVAHQNGAALDLTLNTNVPNPEKPLGADVLDTGSLRLKAGVQVSALPGFQEGHWWVQDAAAAIPARVLDPKKSETVLDLCAAPGGKTMQLAATGATVTAVDLSAGRMRRVQDNLSRTQLSAQCIVADIMDWEPDAPVNAILLDAPCSATGTIRRHPDLPFVKTGGPDKELVALQTQMLARAFNWLTPGGTLVYAVCSLFAAEGEDQANKFIQAHDTADIARIDPNSFGLPAKAATTEGFLRLRPDFWPEIGGMDGFFIAKFTKRS